MMQLVWFPGPTLEATPVASGLPFGYTLMQLLLLLFHFLLSLSSSSASSFSFFSSLFFLLPPIFLIIYSLIYKPYKSLLL
jgi:hypothetical protein